MKRVVGDDDQADFPPGPARQLSLDRGSAGNFHNSASVRIEGETVCMAKPLNEFAATGSLQVAYIGLCAIALIVAALAAALAWGPHQCPLVFPKIIGCALGQYETLASGLIAASAALIAGWLAWSGVQQQIAADERRASADRKEVERLLRSDVDNFADALGSLEDPCRPRPGSDAY
jgi:hypothetical protein